MSSGVSQSIPVFVDRKDEMKRIDEFMKKALGSEGHLLIVRGEPGVGKTRLIQEVADQARSRGFRVGFGAGLSESIIPYQPWTKALSDLGLEGIMEENSPPKLLALYLLDPKGSVITKVKLKDIGANTLKTAETILKQSQGNYNDSRESVVKEGNLVIHVLESLRLLILQDKKLGIGAVIEGLEDEAFLADLRKLADSVGLCFDKPLRSKKRKGDSMAPVRVLLRNLLNMGKYTGIDYTLDNPELRRMRLFNNMALGLARKAAINPVLLILDDLQWIDPSSLALLRYTARNTRQCAVLILSAYRIEEGAVRPHLSSVLKKINQEDLSTELGLTGLAREHLRALVDSFLGPHELPEDFIDHLWTETEGNPLFVREVLRRLEDDEAIQLKAGTKRLVVPIETLAIPVRVREVIRARLELLSKEDRALLDTAAVCGSRFTASLVAEVAGEEESRVLNGLNNIARLHGLLQPAGYDFTFNHSTIQEVVHEALPEETFRTYHRKVAQWLELAGGPIEDIAEHYYQARDKRALAMLYKVASTARAKYANEEAIRFYNEALELEEDARKKLETFENMGAVYELIGEYNKSNESHNSALELTEGKNKKAEIKANIGKIYWLKGEYEESLKAYTDALNLVKGEACEEEARVLRGLGNVYMSKGEYDKVLEHLDRSQEILEKIDDESGTARFLLLIGNVHYHRGYFARALEWYEKSLKLFENLGEQDMIAGCLMNIGNQHRLLGESELAVKYYYKSIEIGERTGHLSLLGKIFQNIGFLHESRGDYNKALECYEKSYAIRERISDQLGIAWLMRNIGSIFTLRGNYDRALEYLKKGLAMMEEIGDQEGIASSFAHFGRIYLYKGDYDKAFEYFEEGLAIHEKIGDQDGIALSFSNIGEVYSNKGDYDKALEYLEKGLAILEKISCNKGLTSNYSIFAELYHKKEDLAKAMQFCKKAFNLSKKSGYKCNLGTSRRIFGMLYAKQEKWNQSKKDFEESLKIFTEIGRKFDEALTHFEFGLMWKAKGDFDNANEHMNKALSIFGKLKLEKRAEEVRVALKTLQT